MANASSHNDSVELYAWKKLTNEDKLYAATCLKETDETRENAIKEIKRWIDENDDLRGQIDEFLILRFLRVCKFNHEKTKIRIRNYYKQCSALPEWFTNLDPFLPELQEMLDMGIYLPLRKPDDQGRLVVILRATVHDPRRHTISNMAKVNVMGIETAIKYYPAASIYGYVMFMDVTNTTIRHAAQFRPQILINSVHTWQHCYPMRIQSINIINTNVFFNITVNIFKFLMSEKMRSRFHVYSESTMQNCFKDIPADILPVEYGGTGGTIQELTDYWKTLIEKNSDFLKNKKNERNVLKQIDLELTENVNVQELTEYWKKQIKENTGEADRDYVTHLKHLSVFFKHTY